MLSVLFISACSGDGAPESVELSGKAVKVATSKPSANQASGASITLNGMVAAKESANISTRVMGNITNISVKEGQFVRKGQTLAQVKNTDLQAQRSRIQAQISVAEAALKNAERNYKRFKSLYESKSVTQKEFNDVEMNYEISKSQVEAAKQSLNELDVQLAYSTVRAPFSGKVAQKMVNEGDMANPGMPLFRLESSGELLIEVNVPESEIQHFQLKDEVAVQVSAINQKFKGKVSLVSPSAAMNGHQYKVEITPNEKPAQLLAGMSAKITLDKPNPTKNETEAKEITGIWVPTSALITKGQLTGVYTVSSQNTAILRWIQLGEENGNQVEVLSGLSKEDVVITNAEGKLYNGVKITR